MGSLADRGIEEKRERALGIWQDATILTSISVTLDDLRTKIVRSYTDLCHPTNMNTAMLDDLYAALIEAKKDNKEASANGRKKTKGLPAK